MDDGFYDVAKRVRRDEWRELCFPALLAGTMSWEHLSLYQVLNNIHLCVSL